MICRDIVAYSTWCWGTIEKSFARGIDVQEETLTELILLELVTHPHNLIRQYTKLQEGSLTGADWEWFVYTPCRRWVKFRVQAKKIKEGYVYKPNHDIRRSRTGLRQIDLLMRRARSNKALPIYVFYNNYDNRITGHPCGCASIDNSLFGWTFTPANRIHRLLALPRGAGTRKTFSFAEVNDQSLPMACLFCTCVFRATGSGSGPGGTDFLDQLMAQFADYFEEYGVGQEDVVSETPPWYVRDMLREAYGEQVTSDRFPVANDESESHTPPRVPFVVITLMEGLEQRESQNPPE
ncbi:DUF6615 family protein [Paenibacillus rubinfantis]|uniref:DUF6615 family protein n=1 Tax=Paenibacillus rubinfantis TaxID=1720296 RepID=UPI00073E1EB7